jgi:K+/H+ antiporter YhaU regulatory subunit KhtT
VPHGLAHKTIVESGIRERTGCTVIAISTDSSMQINPDPGASLPPGGEMILIGTMEEENRFLQLFGRE